MPCFVYPKVRSTKHGKTDAKNQDIRKRKHKICRYPEKVKNNTPYYIIRYGRRK